MSHGYYPCAEQAHEPPAYTPQTEQQERNHETPGRHGRPVHREVAWITGDEVHQEGNEGEDGSCQRACHEAEPATDGNSADDHTENKANEQREREIEQRSEEHTSEL